MLVEGYSSLDNRMAVVREEPLACTWLQTREDRTPLLRLQANPNYWDKARGPHLQEIVFRNDLPTEQALALVCDEEGQVDLVTHIAPQFAERVERSRHAKLVAIDAIRSVAGVINRDAVGLPFSDVRARQALNHAIDRDRLIQETLAGRAQPLGSLTPPAAVTFLHRLSPYQHNTKRAAEFWREAGGVQSRPVRIAAARELEKVTQRVAKDLEEALGISTEILMYEGEEYNAVRQRLASKNSPQDWDILLLEQGCQAADAPTLEIHRAFVGETGEFRAGPIVPKFEQLYADLPRHTSPIMLAQVSYNIDKLVYEEALALFLYAPQSLYAVNKHVEFEPYRTTFELADCKVTRQHWSVKKRGVVNLVKGGLGPKSGTPLTISRTDDGTSSLSSSERGMSS